MGLADVLLWKPRHHVNILVTTVAGSGVSLITTLAVAAVDAAAAAGSRWAPQIQHARARIAG